MEWEEAEAAKRIGVIHSNICRDCGEVTWLDPHCDAKKCGSCNGENVLPIDDMVGKQCPRCKTGLGQLYETLPALADISEKPFSEAIRNYITASRIGVGRQLSNVPVFLT
jgi:hypothetical protein